MSLLTRLSDHYDALPSHSKEQDTARLLKEAIERIKALNAAIDTLPTSKAGCDGMLLVTVEKYNSAVDLTNS